MSWFQTGLSSLTGQIGNFTREVLTEGTEEIEDLPTQLKVARTKLNDTELLCSTQKQELDQLKKYTEELKVQLESRELQIQSITGDFRRILSTKEEELIAIKKRELEFTEAQHSMRKDSFNEGPDDTEDVLLLQHKISHLQNRILFLESEQEKYQQKEKPLPLDASIQGNSDDKIAFLEKRVKSLEQELSDSLDRHQHEFASLQDSHSRNVASLKRNHVNSMEQLKEKILQLEQELEEKGHSNTTDSLKYQDSNGNIPADDNEKSILLEKLEHLEKRNSKLEFDSAQMHAVDRKKTEMIESLQADLKAHQQDVKVLSEKLQKEILSREDLYKEFQLLLEDNQTLMSELNAMKLNHKSEKDGFQKTLKELQEKLLAESTRQISEDGSDFESKIIQLKKELMDAENARILESEMSSEKIRDLEKKLKISGEESKELIENYIKYEEKLESKNLDLEAEKSMMKRTITELEERVKSLAENFAESQRLRENTEAVLAMERRDRECGAIIDRDILKQKNLELETELEKLNDELLSLQESMKISESALIEANEQLNLCRSEIKKDYEEEILTLKNEIKSMKHLHENDQMDKMLNENESLKDELQHLKAKLFNSLERDEDISSDSGGKPSEENNCELVRNMKKEIEDLKQELEQSEAIIKLYEAEVEKLAQLEKDFEDLKQQHEELKKEYERLKGTSNEIKEECLKRSDTSSSLGSERSTSSDAEQKNEITTLRATVAKQEELIKTLNGKYSNVFKLLEDRSVELFGDEKILVKLNQLQNELDSLRKEREHMMSILNDKTREASSLKLEVHRLMEAVSVGKAALTRVQNDRITPVDATGLSQGQVTEEEGDRDDMKREAVKKLSQMIKDRDFEIDALNKKNDTLLQVLQTQSSESMNHEIKRLLAERDALQKQVSSLQVEKEQLVNSFNAKHSESLSYFEELMRQRNLVEGLNAELEKLQLSHRSMAQQLDEKQTSLIKLLDEHSTMRRKMYNMERKGTEKKEEEGGENESIRCSFIIGKEEEEEEDDDDGEATKEGDCTVVEELKNKATVERSNKKKMQSGTLVSKDEVDDCNSKQGGDGGVVSGMVEKLVREKEAIIREKEKVIVELKSKVLYCESEVMRLQSVLTSSENLVKQKDSDSFGSKKQIESLNFRLQDEVNKRIEAQKDLEDLQTKNKTISYELNALKESNAILISNVTQKELELHSLRHELENLKSSSTENVRPLHKLTGDKQSDPGSIEHSSDIPRHDAMGDNDIHLKVEALETIISGLKQREEEFMRGMMIFQKEREQLFLAVHYHQNEAAEAKNSISGLQEREKRLAKECERLRNHLLSIEEGYNREVLEAEEREKELRNQLAAAQERISSLTDSVLSNRSDLTKQTENLQLQLHSMAEQRDNAILQLSSAQETISSYSNSLSNLQMVLEQFQNERINQQSLEVEKFQMAFNKKQMECQELQNHIQSLLVQLEDHSEAIQAAQRLSEQMDKKEHLISALREEVRLREIELNKTGEEIKKLTSSTEAKVDKELMKSLLIGYFHAPSTKRLEAFRVIGHILNFSNEELNNIGMSSSVGWMGGIFKKKATTNPPRATGPSLNQSFSELFVSFLEKESGPNRSDLGNLRLPAERMIAEQQKKKQQESNKPRSSPAFNPFSSPIPTTLGLPPPQSTGVAGSALLEQPSHLLSSQIPHSSSLYPSIVPPSIQGSREKSTSQRDSIVPIVLAAAAAMPTAGELYSKTNSIKVNFNSKLK